MTFVDLRSDIDAVYHQSGGNGCTSHTIINHVEAMLDHAGQSRRFSRAWVWHWCRVHSGRIYQDVGADFDDMKWAIETHGMVLESEHPWTGQAYNPPPNGLKPSLNGITFDRVTPNVETIKRRLLLGLPTGIGVAIHEDFNSLFGQKDWRKTSYNVRSRDTGIRHAMCIVGFDDDAGRLLIENSYGPSFADGGFFGLPYEHLASVQAECWGINRIEGFVPKKAEGYVSIPYLMDASDNADLATKTRPKFKKMLEARLSAGDVQGFIDYCKEWGISDKRVENYFSLERFWVWNFKNMYPQLNWDEFPWAPA